MPLQFHNTSVLNDSQLKCFIRCTSLILHARHYVSASAADVSHIPIIQSTLEQHELRSTMNC